MTSLDQLFGAALIVADAAPDPAPIRARREAAGFVRYTLFDRGSYAVQYDPDEPALFAMLARIAGELTGRTLALAESRVLRLAPGDYLLAHHDAIYDDNPVETVVDLSPASIPRAEVQYRRRGQVFFRVPCAPGSLAVVERGPTVTSNHTYISKRYAGAEVVRLVALFR